MNEPRERAACFAPQWHSSHGVLSACLPGRPPSAQHTVGSRGKYRFKRPQWRKFVDELRLLLPKGARYPEDAPVSVHITLYSRPREKSERGDWNVKFPDGDNMLKSAIDGLAEVGIIHNDAQVSRGVFQKLRHTDPKKAPCWHVNANLLGKTGKAW